MFLLKQFFKSMFMLLGVFIVFVLGYLISAFVLSRITVNATPQPGNAITMHVLTNGVHTDLVLPAQSPTINWAEWFPYEHTIGNDTNLKYIGIGWGDKGFYLNTPTWNDLTVQTAFNAVFGLGGTAVHATYHDTIEDAEKSFTVTLSEEQYAALIQYITSSLTLDAAGKPIHIQTNANYGNSDAFYEANGRYSMFTTCNTWTNNALKQCGQKACFWTPFQSGIFYQYKSN
jgi:uncharacterized protein (TIGR02117 family)